MLYTVRVRGIYATALSVLLYRKGYLLSDVSRVLRERLPIIPSNRAPEVTVKHLEDNPDYLLIIGHPWEAGESVYYAVTGELPYYGSRKGVLGLYTVADAVGLGECRVKLPGGLEAEFEGEPCPQAGEHVRVTVTREAVEEGSKVRVRRGVAVVGPNIIVIKPGSGVSYSEHISEEEREGLSSTLKGLVGLEGVHIRFRSSARLADKPVLENELRNLIVELEKLDSLPVSGEPRVLKRGEFIALVALPSPAKEYLDGLRRTITPTIDRHHSLKSFGEESSKLVECAESQLSLGVNVTGSGIEYYLAKTMQGRFVTLEHHKPAGGVIELGRYHVDSVRLENGGVVVEASKKLTGRGVLDGLNIEKKPGDTAKTRIRSGDWFIVHEYYSSSGSLLGVYANVNTPIEIGPGRVKYLDLYVDVVKRPGREAEVIDAEELEEAYESGVISQGLYSKAVETSEYLKRKLSSTYP